MSWIPCTSACLYQSDGNCTLDSAAAVGLPSDGACIHFIPSHPARLGSPHRYSAPGSDAVPASAPADPSGVPG